jgi:hypothetical protein
MSPPPTARLLPGALLTLGLLVLGARRAQAEDELPPEPTLVPVRASAEVDAKEAADLGLWRVKLTYVAEEDVPRAYRVRLRLVFQGVTLLDLDHAPRVPTSQWTKGRRVDYEIPVPVPLESGMKPGTLLELRLGFIDLERDVVLPFLSDDVSRAGLLTVAALPLPELLPTDGEERTAALLARADALAKAGHAADAWRLLETGLRRAQQDPTKRRMRDGLMKLGSLAPAPLSPLEEQIVAERIAAERLRFLREESGRQFDRKRLFAALRLLELVGGTLEEQGGAAVIGALADAKRAQKDLVDLKVRILGSATDEQKAAAARLLEKPGPGPALLKEARALRAGKQFAVARQVLHSMSLSGDMKLAAEAKALLAETEAAWLADTPPEEAQAVEAAKNHPAFTRLGTVVTHKFVYIGPKKLVEGVPPDSRLRYDLAYVFLSDLFGTSPNPGGDRITIYWKELWDFGGGQAGGRTIDIGRADPEAAATRVDNGLMYHELTHCIDDTNPIYSGFREGLANFGAAYLFEMLGQDGDQAHAFASNLEAFRRDYLGRDLAYWRIQDYGPSAGFFLHFADKYTRVEGGHDWGPYRRFFRAYRAAPVGDGREPYIARALAHYLVESFGPGAFDDLLRFRFPLVESDREAVKKELEAWGRGEGGLAEHVEEFVKYPNSPLVRDLLARAMLAQRGNSEKAREVGRALGIVYDWRVIGPFRSPGADPRARIFPPEEEIDYAKQYEDGLNSCRWRVPEAQGVVAINPLGWVSLNFSYMDDTATYALTWLTVPHDVDAFVHLRADDDVALFLNDRRVEGYVARGVAHSQVWFRGPYAPMPDAMRLPVRLVTGRNKLLLKVKNRGGQAGFVLAVSKRDGQAIEDLKVDADAPAPTTVAVPAAPTLKQVLDHSFRAKRVEGTFDVAVGRFKVANKTMVGEATDRQVAWRRYSVRPGYPTDGPSNLLWLKERATEGAAALRLTLDVTGPKNQAPKLAVILQGDGGTDGLSGWTLVVHPDGDRKVGARLERLEDLHYQLPATEIPAELLAAESLPLVLAFHDDRLTVTLGPLVLFKGVSLHRLPDRHRIGLATWGPDTAVHRIELLRSAPAK